MNIIKEIVKKILWTTGTIGGVIALPLGLNTWSYHNTEYFSPTRETRTFSKIDGILSHTEFIFYPNGAIQVNRGNKKYYSKDRGFEVDSIEESSLGLFSRGGSYYERFERDKHGRQYPEKFAKADKEFIKQRQRFHNLINY